MNYNYDDERPDGEIPLGGETPADSAPDSAGEDADVMQSTSGASFGRFYTPLAGYNQVPPEEPPPVTPTVNTAAVPEPTAKPHSESWRDPAYSAVPERGPTVYSPGISQPSYQHKHERRNERADVSNGTRRGGLARAACLVFVCALASAAATFGVLEYKLDDASSPPPTAQTQPAGNSDNLSGVPGAEENAEPETNGQGSATSSPGIVTRPIITTGISLTAQEIYEMACRQVVVIKTNVMTRGSYFNPGGTSVISGSGFIIREDGYIVTNYHVVEAAYVNGGDLNVTLNNGEVYPAVIIGVEQDNDIAVIKIDAAGLDPVAIGDSSAMRVGESVYAVGNPLGELIYTITDGIISALDREITVETTTMNMFQISAAVNSGNSGGPVYDTFGNVIGVVTAKFNSSSVEGIGFAIPINDAMRIANQFMVNGYIVDSKAYLGITVKTVDRGTAEYYNWVVGAYVMSVEANSCADKAGLMVGDIITKVGSISVTSQESLIYAKKCFNAGDTTEIMVRRAGEDVTLTITFDTEPESTAVPTPTP